MLAALGLAACSGVLAIIAGNSETVWRVAGTCLATALAAAIMMPMSAWADKAATRTAGLVGMCISVAVLLLGAILIWGDFFSWQVRAFLGECIAIVFGCGLTSVWFLKQLNADGWRRTAQIGALGAAVSGLIFFAAAVEDTFLNTGPGIDEKLVITGMALFWSMIPAALSLVGFSRPDPRWWRWIGVLSGAAGMLMIWYGCWIKNGDDPTPVVAAYAIAYCIAHTILCLRCALVGAQRWVRVVAIASAAATGVSAVFSVHVNPRHDLFSDFDFLWRITTGSGLICVSATLALVVFGRLNRRTTVVQLTKTTFDSVSLTCPRCEKHLKLPVGGAICDSCKLHINISVASTLCQCGYDLTNLKADKCPECGTPIPSATGGLVEAIEA